MERDEDFCMATVVSWRCMLWRPKYSQHSLPAKNITIFNGHKVSSKNEDSSSVKGRSTWNPNGERKASSVKIDKEEVIMGNILRVNRTLFRAESLKKIADAKYSEGQYKEALTLYDQAIAMDATKASYHGNKSAALIRLGLIVDAVFACREAVKLNPDYAKAHLRLAKLYIRLGKPDDALDHWECEVSMRRQAKKVKLRLKKCNGARIASKWLVLLEESDLAIASGVDSSPLVHAMKIEALYKLHRFQESYEVYSKSPRYITDKSVKFFGRRDTSETLAIAARVNLSAGRFEAASKAAQEAVRVDPRSKEAGATACTVRSVADARLSGNLLFEGLKFREACVMYSVGLAHDPFNTVLLCNRAACLVNLRRFAKAIDDCSRALLLQPSYAKARLRRAHCYLKMEKWESAMQDYKVLAEESPSKYSAEGLKKAQSQAHQRQLMALH